MVTICTASLTFNNSTFCPQTVFMCFVWIWEQTAIISLNSINWLVFITETGCVYCAVRAGSLNIIQINKKLHTAITAEAHGVTHVFVYINAVHSTAVKFDLGNAVQFPTCYTRYFRTILLSMKTLGHNLSCPYPEVRGPAFPLPKVFGVSRYPLIPSNDKEKKARRYTFTPPVSSWLHTQNPNVSSPFL